MRCTACGADNPTGAEACSACGTRLIRTSRRRTPAGTTDAWAGQSLADVAYRCGVWGLIPFVGLVLGPAALVLGLAALRRGSTGPAEQGTKPALVAIAVGALILVTNWVGVGLMILGLGSGR